MKYKTDIRQNLLAKVIKLFPIIIKGLNIFSINN